MTVEIHNERMERVMFEKIKVLPILRNIPRGSGAGGGISCASAKFTHPVRRRCAGISASLYGACAPMRKLFRKIERLRRSNARSSSWARAAQGRSSSATPQLSARAAGPFIAINLRRLARTSSASFWARARQLHRRAAHASRCFERADGGTVFLDEITEMPLEMQVRLLRVLETGKFCRVGGDQELSTDVRVLAATNRDLQPAVASGRLREDLMYRLCVIPVTVPPLRERGEDSVLLAQMFLNTLNEEHGEAKHLSDDAMRCIRITAGRATA
jgi:DNA-binding NtrC family response regulator